MFKIASYNVMIILLGSTLCFVNGSEGLLYKEACVGLKINLDCKFNCKDVSVNACLVNNCDREIIFKRRFHIGSDLMLTVTDSQNKRLPLFPPAPPPPLDKKDFVEIAPGKCLQFEIKHIQNNVSERFMHGREYSVFITYYGSSGKKFGFNAYEGRIESNQVSFRYLK